MEPVNHHKIIIADSRSMPELADESVHLVITSPPYWQLKDYDKSGQIGFHNSYEEYINHLNLVWDECRRVLHKGCRLCVNIGDQFARAAYYGRYKVIPIRTEIIKYCETIGFDYMGAIIWQKATTCNTTGGATIMGSYPYPRNGAIKIDYEFILLFKKPGDPPKADKTAKEQSKLTVDQWNRYFAGHWNFSGEKQDKHLAMFPEELPGRLIRMFSFVGETVLDPFLGSGTTSLAAKNLNRNSIGYEINESFLPVIKKKIMGEQPDMFNRSTMEIANPARGSIDSRQKIKISPYVFHDPVRFEKKIGLKEKTFGSTIHMNQKEKEPYFRLSRVNSPTTIELNNGIVVRLIGIRPKKNKELEAVNWLFNKLKGELIYLKYDNPKYDENHRARCYVYLKNKTFINLHLLRSELVELDDEITFRYLDKFKAVSRTPEMGDPLSVG